MEIKLNNKRGDNFQFINRKLFPFGFVLAVFFFFVLCPVSNVAFVICIYTFSVSIVYFLSLISHHNVVL